MDLQRNGMLKLRRRCTPEFKGNRDRLAKSTVWNDLSLSGLPRRSVAVPHPGAAFRGTMTSPASEFEFLAAPRGLFLGHAPKPRAQDRGQSLDFGQQGRLPPLFGPGDLNRFDRGTSGRSSGDGTGAGISALQSLFREVFPLRGAGGPHRDGSLGMAGMAEASRSVARHLHSIGSGGNFVALPDLGS